MFSMLIPSQRVTYNRCHGSAAHHGVLPCREASTFDDIQSVYFFLSLPIVLVPYSRNHDQIQCYKDFPCLCFRQRFLWVFLHV